jgi:hypothetical protein
MGAMGFAIKIFLYCSGIISRGYSTGDKYIQAIAIMPRICSRSLKYTVIADTIKVTPRASTYSAVITRGKKQRACGFKGMPDSIKTINIMIKLKSILIKHVVTKAIGRTSLGKYIFFTRFPW